MSTRPFSEVVLILTTPPESHGLGSSLYCGPFVLLKAIGNQMVEGKRFHIPVERHTSIPKRIIVSPHAKMVLGVFLSEDSREDMRESFWQDHKPTVEGERWAKRKHRLPPKLGVCFAFAGEGCLSEVCYLGAPFEFAQPSLLAEHVAYP